MNLENVRREIKELKNSIIWQREPIAKAFVLGKVDSPTEVEIQAYRETHLHTNIVVLHRRSCRRERYSADF